MSIDRVPAPARAAIDKAAASGTLRRVEAVSEHRRGFYEAGIKKGSKNPEITVDAAGNVIR
jgi:hypothetical protein